MRGISNLVNETFYLIKPQFNFVYFSPFPLLPPVQIIFLID